MKTRYITFKSADTMLNLLTIGIPPYRLAAYRLGLPHLRFLDRREYLEHGLAP